MTKKEKRAWLKMLHESESVPYWIGALARPERDRVIKVAAKSIPRMAYPGAK